MAFEQHAAAQILYFEAIGRDCESQIYIIRSELTNPSTEPHWQRTDNPTHAKAATPQGIHDNVFAGLDPSGSGPPEDCSPKSRRHALPTGCAPTLHCRSGYISSILLAAC